MFDIVLIVLITGLSVVYLSRHIWKQSTGEHKCDSCSLDCPYNSLQESEDEI